MTFDLQEVARAVRAAGEFGSVKVTGWSVDTRTQNPGDLYFALRGERFDGHDFVAQAVQKGAAGVVVERPSGAPVELIVPDSLRALQELGRWARERWGGTVVGVTGSAGKTTTKDAIAHLLAVEIPTGKTVGNFNNHVGVPLSILRLPECRAAVLEMGMNHAGEIRDLAAIARPQVGVVTNVGYAHVEFFEDGIEGVARAKRELIEALPPDGVAVLNADDPRVAQFRDVFAGRSMTFGFSEGADVRGEGWDGQTFRASGVDFVTTMTGRHGVMNLLAAIATARVFGLAPERLWDAVRTFEVGKMRGERMEHDGIVVWNDCYNANPEAMQSMIDVLRGTAARKRIAVLGEMLELGASAGDLHRRVGRYAAENGVDLLVGVRGHARGLVEAASAAGAEAKFFEDAEEAGEFVRGKARPGDAVLFKGSRGVKVEKALERFLGK
jgi:UDP-N-acetylmuramoyl-tripeptide--D-alanyl-D-alanine ligase